MNCPCDQIIFPPPLVIPAGLASLPRQIATFPEFRAAMLAAIPGETALNDWRARGSGDFGVMLLEMWSYVCDCISFYDEVIANECYVRTSSLRPSIRKLVGLLGYVPRPAIAARVELAILADGRQPIALPAGTAFRSGGFPGGSPQVFELDADSRAHPFLNRTAFARSRPATLERGPPYSSHRSTFLLDPRTARLKADQLAFIEDLGNAANNRARIVQRVDDVTASDHATYRQATLASTVPIPGSTPVANVRVSVPSQTGTVFQHPFSVWPSGLISFSGISFVVFASLQRQIQLGDTLVLDKSGDVRWFRVIDLGERFANLPSDGPTTITDPSNHVTTVRPPALQVQVTLVRLDADFNDPSRREGATSWTDDDAAYVKVHFGFRKAGDVVVAADLTLRPGDPMRLLSPFELPQDGKFPSRFLLEDNDTVGAGISATIDLAAGTLKPSKPLAEPLAAPVTVYGNIVTASRGETVGHEVLGNGDGSAANQAFQLKKSPLTYLPAPDGAQSTLRVYVNGLQWTEVPSFFGVAADARAYIVRQNDDGDSFVVFGDGIRGSRLVTGAGNVVARYRYGAGKLTPSAGSIHQMAKAVKGVISVRNPVAAAGGDDAEPASGLGTYAPRSALLLGRAISIPDMEVAAAGVGGVRTVRSEWRWNAVRQRPVVHVWYIGDAAIIGDVTKKLRGLSDGVTPIAVDEAIPVPSTLSLAIETDPRRIVDDVLNAVRSALMDKDTGLLAPEQIGIGLPLFRSRIFDAVLAVPGTIAVTGLLWNGAPFDQYGIDPGAGRYFDLEGGALVLNGKAAANA
jgi:hypothetical protein